MDIECDMMEEDIDEQEEQNEEPNKDRNEKSDRDGESPLALALRNFTMNFLTSLFQKDKLFAFGNGSISLTSFNTRKTYISMIAISK